MSVQVGSSKRTYVQNITVDSLHLFRCVQAADWPVYVAVAAPLIAAAPPLLCMARFVPQASPQLEHDE